jgi:hypothetical protein
MPHLVWMLGAQVGLEHIPWNRLAGRVARVPRRPRRVADQRIEKHALVLCVRDAGRRALLTEERRLLQHIGEMGRMSGLFRSEMAKTCI